LALKEKTINGIIWGFLGNFINLGINFAIGIILARILSPKEFGLIGMVTIFITISEMFINSGFSQSLTRKNDCTEIDYSTVFNFNILISTLFYSALFFAAPFIAKFYGEESITNLIRVLSLSLIINSLTLIQRVIITKKLNFKLLNNTLVFSNIISGTISIILAYKGFGVWSLVFKNIIRDIISSSIFWIINKWIPIFTINKKSFKELFGFGYKLLLSGIIGSIINNIQYILIGKYFSANELGFYTRAELFKNLPSQNIESVISSVSYPALAKIQDDSEKLTLGFKKLFLNAVFLVSFFMVGTAVIAEPLIIILVGEKWRQSIIYLQMLTVVGFMYPLLSININLANIVGRSDLYLKFQFISQLISLIIIIPASFWGIKSLIIGIILNSTVSYIFYANVANKFINYKIIEQIKDTIIISLYMIVSWAIPALLYLVFSDYNILFLVAQIVLAILILVLISEFFKQKEYLEIKKIITNKINIK
jgi:teichuronic acid exporter